MIAVSVVNMIPNSWSGEQNQDSETGISFNPSNSNELVGTAFTFDNPAGSSALSPAMTGAWAPVYHSTDGGNTWSLEMTLPSGAGDSLPTFDVTTRFSGNAQTIYSGLISSASSNILINRASDPTTQMATLVTITGSPDQPFVEAATSGGKDKVYVGYNASSGATIQQSLDAATAAAPAGFTSESIDARNSSAGPKIRVAIHSSGTVYAAFYSANTDGTYDVVVVKDTDWGGSGSPYTALTDSSDHKAGTVVAKSVNADPSGSEDAAFGHDRRGWELALTVDPNDADRLYIVYSDGTSSSDYTLHVRQSTDGGSTWQADARTIVKAKNPGLAINADGDVGFLYQQVTGATGSESWVTIFEHTANDFAGQDSWTLCTTSAETPTPASDMATYIGDYAKLQASGRDFVGTFATSNAPDKANFPAGITYQRNVNWTTRQLLATDNTTVVQPSIDPFFFSAVKQDLTITTDRSTFGEDEINAMLLLANPGGPPFPNPAVISAAFYVVVDGFSHTDLGISSTTLSGTPDVAPTITFNPNLTEVTATATKCEAEGGSLVPGRQRFTWTYELNFSGTADFGPEVEPVTMTGAITGTSGTSVNGQAIITLTTQPNPYEIDGPTSWLSVDLQVFNLLEGGSLPSTPGIKLGSDPNAFITALLADSGGGYNDPTLPRAPGHPFDNDLVQNEDTSSVSIAGKIGGVSVFNFAVARVRYRALSTPAANVRTFFRLFQCSTTSTVYDSSTTYLNGGTGGDTVPLLGVVNGEVVSIPCFAAARVDPTNSQGLNAQTDPANVGPVGESIPADASGNEVQVYFGCWLDINQPTLTMPASSAPATGASSYTPGRSVQDVIRGQHECLVAEIFLEPPEPQLQAGDTPASSDKLAQRNLTITGVASPHQVPTTFDVKRSRVDVPRSATPDELMFEWGALPAGSEASIYLPGTTADAILALASQLYRRHDLAREDAYTVRCPARGLTYLPLPAGAGSNYAGLLTVQVPSTVKRGERYDVLVRQVRNVSARRPREPEPGPTPELAVRRTAAGAAAVDDEIHWREVIGSFQVSIPVSTKAALLPTEERLLSVMRWINRSIPRHDRWHPVFHRYLEQLAGRVTALGGEPGSIVGSWTGEGGRPLHPPHPHPHPHPHPGGIDHDCLIGKVAGLTFDHFGDFDGFILETEHGEHRFRSRERNVADLVERAWRERLRIKVCPEPRDHDAVRSITVLKPPQPFGV